MAVGRNKKDRHVIPRWRSIRRTIEAGEFKNLSEARPLPPGQQNELDAATQRWDAVGTDLAAAELVGMQLVAGVPDDQHPAIESLIASENPTYRSLGQRVRDPHRPSSSDRLASGASTDEFLHAKVRDSKRRIDVDPRNPIAWSDIARRYTALGQIEQARQALAVARALAPDSRYLLRVSARFYVHIGEPGAAARLLRDSARTNEDPWLMATLLSTTSLDRKPLPGIRVARRILESGRFQEIEKSDLVSELATLELKAGSDRAARKLFERSLVDPTDNSLAQAEWASQKLLTLEVEPERLEVPFKEEALAQAAAQRGEWQIALAESWGWLDDQPFDTAAAIHTSYVAAVGNDDWAASAKAAQVGLRANPHDPMLANNCAYALLEMDDIADAAPYLRTARQHASERLERVAVTATSGLMEFRQGNAEAGRQLYRDAIDLAKRSNEAEAEAMARSMLAREELRAGLGVEAANLLQVLEKLAKRVKDPGVVRVLTRVTDLVASADSDPDSTSRRREAQY